MDYAKHGLTRTQEGINTTLKIDLDCWDVANLVFFSTLENYIWCNGHPHTCHEILRAIVIQFTVYIRQVLTLCATTTPLIQIKPC